VKVERIANIKRAERNWSLLTVSKGDFYYLQLVCRSYAETHPIFALVQRYKFPFIKNKLFFE
jgi:hypothetical protein